MGLLFKELLPSPCLWTFNYIAWGADAIISKNALVVATVNEFQHQIGAFVEFSCLSPPMFAGVFPINSSHELHQWSMNTSLCPEAKFPKTLWPICPPWVLCSIASTYNMFLKYISKNKSYCLFSVWYAAYIYIHLHGSSNLASWDLATLCHHSYCFGHFVASESELLFLARTNRFKSWKPPGGLVFPKKKPGQLHKENNPRHSKRSCWTITWPSPWHLILHLWCCWRRCRSRWRRCRSRWRCGSRCCCLPSPPWCEWIHGTLGDHLIKA